MYDDFLGAFYICLGDFNVVPMVRWCTSDVSVYACVGECFIVVTVSTTWNATIDIVLAFLRLSDSTLSRTSPVRSEETHQSHRVRQQEPPDRIRSFGLCSITRGSK